MLEMESPSEKITLREYAQTAANSNALTPFDFGAANFGWNTLYKYYMGVDLAGNYDTLTKRAELVKFGQLLCGEAWYHDVISINPDETGDDLKCDNAREWISKAITWLCETSDKNLALIEIYASKIDELKALAGVKRTDTRQGTNTTTSHRTGNNATTETRGGTISRTSNDTDKGIDAPNTAYVAAEQETHVSSVNLNSHTETETPNDTTTTSDKPDETNTTTETPNETNVSDDQKETLMRRIAEIQSSMKNVYEEWVREFERLFLLPPEMF